VTEASTLELATGTAPIVKLDDKHYKLVDKMEALTLRAPSLVGAKALTVKGPVKFVPGTTIKGEVTITNGGPVDLSDRRVCRCRRTLCSRRIWQTHVLLAALGIGMFSMGPAPGWVTRAWPLISAGAFMQTPTSPSF
jgi:hypothetical protein